MSDDAPRLGVIETEGAEPPIALLHGLGGAAASWSSVQARLGRAALAFDLPGHAGSLDYPGFGSASFAAKAVINEMDARGIGAFHLAGHSMGGAVAALIACRSPERVLSMTLLAPGGFGAEINAPLLRRFGAAVTADEISACLKIMFAPGAVMPETLIAAQLTLRAVRGQTDALAHIASKILNGDRQGVLDGGQLAALAMPVSVVWGGRDRVVPPEQLRNAPEHFHQLLLAERGHMLLDEVPERAAAEINETMKRAA